MTRRSADVVPLRSRLGHITLVDASRSGRYDRINEIPLWELLEVAEIYLETGSPKEVGRRLDRGTSDINGRLTKIRKITGFRSSVDACQYLLYGRKEPR